MNESLSHDIPHDEPYDQPIGPQDYSPNVRESRLGLHVLETGHIIGADGVTRNATLDDVRETGIKVDIKVTSDDGRTQTLSDGTFYDSEFGIHYE